MQYRPFGKTGDSISALGFGCMRLPEIQQGDSWMIDEEKAIPMLQEAVRLGVNYFDTGLHYCHGNSEYIVGKALHAVRRDVLFSTKIPMGHVKETADYRRQLERSLKAMDTDYIDYYHFWGMGKDSYDEKIAKFDLMKEAQKAKDEGLIRHISFSFHDDADAIKYIIDRGEIFESMLVQYNLLDRSNEEMIAYAASKGLGVVSMGPVAGGRLAAPTELYQKLTNKAPMATYELALRFVLGNPNMSCALSGMQTMEMLQQNVAIANDETPLSTGEWEQIGGALEELKKFSDLYCTGCAYCQPCPMEIDIPAIFNFYTYHNVYGLSALAKQKYAEYGMKGGKTAADCSTCGLCEEKCPQKLRVREELVRVGNLLEDLE